VTTLRPREDYAAIQMAPSDDQVWALLVSMVNTLQSVALGMRDPLVCRCGEWHWWNPYGEADEKCGHVMNPAAPIFVPETTCAAAAGWSMVGRRAGVIQRKATTVGAAGSSRSNRFAALSDEDSGSDGADAGGEDTHVVSGDVGIGALMVGRKIVTKKQRKRMSTALKGCAAMPDEGSSGFRGGGGARARVDSGFVEKQPFVVTKSYDEEEEPIEEESRAENVCWANLVQSESSGFSFETRHSREGGASGSKFHWEPKGFLSGATTCSDAGIGSAHETEAAAITVGRKTERGQCDDRMAERRALVEQVGYDDDTIDVVTEFCNLKGMSLAQMRRIDPYVLAGVAWRWKDPHWQPADSDVKPREDGTDS
jgi:hypothetical protein